MQPRDFLYGNSPDALLVAACVSLSILAFVWILRFVARKKLASVQRTPTDLDDLAVDLAGRSKLFLLFFPALYLGIRFLIVPRDLGRLMRAAAEIAFVAQVALWASGVIEHWLRRYRKARMETDPESATTVNVFRIALLAVVWIVAMLVAVENLGFNVTTVVASLGIGGVAVALAMQNILGDLFASLSIIIDKPFIVGDSIMVDKYVGTVEHIGMKTTRVRSSSGEELVFSNGDLLRSRIHNFKRMTRRRTFFHIYVDYETPVTKLERIPEIVGAIVRRQPHVTFDRVNVMAFAEPGYDVEVAYYVDSPEYSQFASTLQAVNLEIVRAFEAEGIAFAYATRSRHVAHGV